MMSERLNQKGGVPYYSVKRIPMIRTFTTFGAALLLLPLVSSEAGAVEKDIVQLWHYNDICSEKSFELFPNFTAEDLEKRERYVRKCNLSYGAPARVPFTVPGSKRAGSN